MVKRSFSHPVADFPIDTDAIPCNLCETDCMLVDGAICKSGALRRVGKSLILLNYGQVIHLSVGEPPVELEGSTKSLYVNLLGGSTRSLSTDLINLSRFYHKRSVELGKFRTIDAIERAGTFYSPVRLLECAIESGSDSILFYGGDPAVHHEYLNELGALSGARASTLVKVYMKVQFGVKISYLKELLAVLDGVTIQFDCLDDAYNFKKHGYRTDGMVELIRDASRQKKLKAIHTTMTPNVNDSPTTMEKMNNLLEELGSDFLWVISRNRFGELKSECVEMGALRFETIKDGLIRKSQLKICVKNVSIGK